MEIDGYHACPCHSERKIKFCCGKEILGDLNQLLAKQQAGQELAALEEVERAIKRHGPQDCLLTMKTQLLLEHNELDKALEVNAQFRAKNPQHPAGFHQLALLRLEAQDVPGAVDALQDAVDAVKGNEIPVFLITGFRAVGLGLMAVNLPLAARAHFRFAGYLSGDQDEELKQFYVQTFLRQEFGFLQRTRLAFPELDPSEQSEEWGKKIATAQKAIARGQFRKSLKYLTLAAEQFPNHRKLIESIAILSGYLADREKSAAAWTRFAALPEVEEVRAIEAEILAINYRMPETHDKVDSIELTCEVSDFGAALEHCLSHQLLRTIEHPEWNQEGPRPRNSFLILNQPYANDPNVAVDLIPYAIGTLDCFGKQTDCEARFVWHYDSMPGAVDQIKATLREFDRWSVGSPTETLVESIPIPYNLTVAEWLLPQGITPFERDTLVSELLMRQLKGEWSDAPTVLLNGKSPREAARLPELQRRAKGILYCLQLDALPQQLAEEQFLELGSALNLTPPMTTELGDRRIYALTPLELMTLKLDPLTDQQLREVVIISFPLMLRPVLRKALRLLMDRPDTDDEFPKHAIAHQLGLLSTSLAESLQLLAQARSKASQVQFPIGNYLVDEFQLRLSRGVTDRLEQLLTVIYKSHIHEPQVAQRISQILQRFGLAAVPEDWEGERSPARVSQPGAPVVIPSAEPAEPAPSGSKLWLPD